MPFGKHDAIRLKPTPFKNPDAEKTENMIDIEKKSFRRLYDYKQLRLPNPGIAAHLSHIPTPKATAVVGPAVTTNALYRCTRNTAGAALDTA